MFQTTLIAGGEFTDRKDRLLGLLDTIDTSPEYILYPAEDTDKPMRIDDVREAQARAHIRPSKNMLMVVVLLELQRATAETQNALLKLLEEPPEYVRILTTVDNKDKLLPTILSRAHILRIVNTPSSPSALDPKSLAFLSLLSETSKKRFEYAAKLAADKQSARSGMRDALTALRHALLAAHNVSGYRLPPGTLSAVSTSSLAGTVSMVARALTSLEYTNTNPRLLVENLLISFPQKQGKNA